MKAIFTFFVYYSINFEPFDLVFDLLVMGHASSLGNFKWLLLVP